MWSIHIMGCYSTPKRNEVLTHATTWMNLENIRLSDRSKTQNATYHMIHLYEMSGIGKFTQIWKHTGFQGIGGRGWWEVDG